jgi:hypothetical protein
MNNGKQKHTPGPWKHGGPTILSGGAWNLVVAILPTTIDPRPTADAAAHTIEEREANARLIAAAPDMLQALEHAQSMLETASRYFPKSIKNGDRFSLLNTLANSVNPALAKARGE